MKSAQQHRLKIFLVGTEFVRGTGGIQYVNRLLLRAFAQISEHTPCAIEVFSFSDSRETLRFDFPTGDARLHSFDRGRAAMAAGLARRLAAVRPHLVLFTHVRLLPLARLVRFIAPGTKLAVLAHGIEVWSPLAAGLQTQLRAADAVIAPSEFTRQKLTAVNGVLPEKMRVLAHGLDPEFISGSGPHAPREPHTALCVARMNRADLEKGVELTIAAMPHVISRCPAAKLLIAGDGDDRARLQQFAASLDLRHGVEFLGEVSSAQLRDLYDRAGIFVLPSKKEGFGIVFLEAMACGLPVVAARAAAAPEVVLDGVTGILVAPDDARALGSAICGLMLLDEEREAMGAAGRLRVAQGFQFADFSARWQRMIAELCPEEFYLARHAAAFAGAQPARTP